ncbi:MAG: hypothetical protein PHP06_10995, partial [Clostridia bacterium]|nr:hypothetical protein [Clostridia bacterium]
TRSFGLFGSHVAIVVGATTDISLIWDTSGNVGVSVSVGLGTGVDVSANPFTGVTNEIVDYVFDVGNMALSYSPGSIFDQAGFSNEGHVGFILGRSFDVSTGQMANYEFGNLGGGVYWTYTTVVPIHKSQ